MLVSHTCNPSYSGGHGSKPTLGKTVREALSQKKKKKKKNHTKGLVEWLKV
jgi:hypothetical protein